MCGTSTSAPASVIATAWSGSNTYGVVSRPSSAAARIMSTSSPNPMPVSSRLARNVPSISPTVGKFCTPAKPASAHLAQEDVHQPERVGPADAGEDRRVAHDRQHLAGHLHDDRVGVAVRHQPGERAAPGHPVAAGVVDHDQVDAARLVALGRSPVPAPAPMIRPAAVERARAASRAPRRRSSRPHVLVELLRHGGGERGIVDVAVHLDQLHAARRAPRAARRTAPRRPRGRGTAGPRRRSSTRRASGRNSAVGPGRGGQLAGDPAPSSAHSSRVVRISVTDGLCTYRLRPSNCGGHGVAGAEVDHVERAERRRPGGGRAARPPRAGPGRPRARRRRGRRTARWS